MTTLTHPTNKAWSTRSRFARCLVLFVFCGLMTSLAGCAVSTTVNARLSATLDVNADNSDVAYPIVVRLYELKNTDAFIAADFFALYDDDKTVLGDALIKRTEVELAPGDARQFKRELSEDTMYLGVVAAYREIETAEWQAAFRLRELRPNQINITIGRQGLTLKGR